MTSATTPSSNLDPASVSALVEAPEAIVAQGGTHLPAIAASTLAPPTAAPEQGDPAGMLAAIDRLEGVLEHETRALGTLSTAELKDLNRRKSLCLLEFTRAARPLAEQIVPDAVRLRLERLRDVIARNQAVLATHLDAVREIAGTIAGALEARESDGTYTQPRAGSRVR